ncbi:hypothetical protein B0H14DRAFT_1160203 [Mycena olivaceomarginata]|nr:hypothetical protein B0H14DRAFT_1160203 [Mycena olivaceomarginata]
MQESGIQSVISAPSHTTTHSALIPLKISLSVAHTFKMRRSRRRPRPSCTRQRRMSTDGPTSLELSAPPNKRLGCSYSRGLCSSSFCRWALGMGCRRERKEVLTAQASSTSSLLQSMAWMLVPTRGAFLRGLAACTFANLSTHPFFLFQHWHLLSSPEASGLSHDGRQHDLSLARCSVCFHSMSLRCTAHPSAAVRTAFAFTPPVPPAARAFLCAHQTGRVPRAGGRLLRLAAPAFVADDAPNVRNHMHGALLPRRRLFITVASESTTCSGGRCGRAVASWPPCAVILLRLPDG